MTLRESHAPRFVVAIAAAAIGLTVAPGTAHVPVADDATRTSPLAGRDRTGPDREQNREFTAEQTDRQVRTIPLGTAGLLELRNVSGNITVSAAAGRDTQVEIVRRARARTEAEAKLGLERTRIVVDHKGDRAMVAVEPPADRRQPFSVNVAYTVTAPAGTRIVASSVSGNVVISDIRGDVTAQVTSGDITISRAGQVSSARTISGDVTLTDLDSDRGLVVNALSGDVRLERVRARRVDVEVTSGDVVLRQTTSDSIRVSSLSGSIEYAGALVPNGRYAFIGHSGTVRLFLVGPVGMELEANTFSGSLRLDPSLDLKAPLARRGSVRATVGDGSATVTATSFSGDVVVTRK